MAAPQEFWCPRCRVTHPPERKVCVHCGGRTEPHRDGAPIFDSRAAVEHLSQTAIPGGRSPRRPGPAEAAEDETEPESPTARGARIAITLVWIALAIGASLLRMCQEPG
jgi:hypothetical protein